MQLLVDIEEHKAEFVLELLSNFKFVKAQRISKEKHEFLQNLIIAANEVSELKSGNANG